MTSVVAGGVTGEDRQGGPVGRNGAGVGDAFVVNVTSADTDSAPASFVDLTRKW